MSVVVCYNPQVGPNVPVGRCDRVVELSNIMASLSRVIDTAILLTNYRTTYSTRA